MERILSLNIYNILVNEDAILKSRMRENCTYGSVRGGKLWTSEIVEAVYSISLDNVADEEHPLVVRREAPHNQRIHLTSECGGGEKHPPHSLHVIRGVLYVKNKFN